MTRKPAWQVDNPYSKVLVLLGLVILALGLFAILVPLSVSPLFGINGLDPDLVNKYEDPAVLNVLKYMQLLSSIGIFILPPIVFAYMTSTSAGRYLKIDRRPLLSSSLLVIAAMVAAIPLINWLSDLNHHMSLPSWMSGLEEWMKRSEESIAGLTKALLTMNTIGEMLFVLFLVALVPAMGEELLFRAGLQGPVSRITRNVHTGIVITAILFSAMHMQFYGFLPRMLLGVYLGYLFVWSGNLWIPILAHFTNNGAVVLSEYLKSRSLLPLDTDSIGTRPSDWIVTVPCVLIFGLLSYLIYKQEKSVVR